MPLSGDRPDPDCAHNYFALNQNTFAGARRLILRKNGVEYQQNIFLVRVHDLPDSAKLILSLFLSEESANLTKAFSPLND